MVLIKIRRKISLVFFILGLSLLLNGCGQNSSGGTTNTNNSSNSFIKELSIDNMGTIPLLGTTNTRTLTWIHNNSDVTISDIEYHAVTNLNDNEPMLDPDSIKTCKSIKPHQLCYLIINGVNHQKPYSGLITLKYKYDGELKTTSQSVNFAPVATQTDGVFFSSNITVSSVVGNKGYGVFYVYAAGNNQVYNISSLKVGNSGAVITNGNISNQQIPSGFVQAVEVSVYNADSSYNIPITVDANLVTTQSATKQTRLFKNNILKSDNFLNTAYVSALPNNGAVLVSSLPPILNTAEESNHSLYFVTNVGNADANISDITPTTDINLETGNNQCSSGVLAAGDSCSVYYSVSNSSPTSSTNTINVNYTGGATGYNTTSQSIYWFNGKNSPMVSMVASDNPATFVQSVGTDLTITVTNVGGLPLEISNVPNPSTYTGSGVATVSPSGNNCSGTNLNPGASCSFVLNINDSVTEAQKQINVYLQGRYLKDGTIHDYSTVMALYYTSTSSQPILIITPNPVTLMSVVGNNIESVTRNLIISNVGTESAAFSSMELINNPVFMSTNNGDVSCGASLEANESCSVIVKLGPASSATEQNGIAHYQLVYTGLNVVSAQESNNIPWQVTPNEQSLTLTSVTASGSIDGTGASTNQLIFSGSTPSSSQVISLQYTNTGTHALTISGFQSGSLGYAWNISSNSCTSNVVLEPSDTCTITYTSNLNIYNQAAFGSSSVLATANYAVNLPVPSFVVIDNSSTPSMQFTIQPDLSTALPDTTSLTEVMAEVHLAVLTNMISVNDQGTPGAYLMVTHTLANANGYPSISLSTMMENYFSSNSLDGGCIANSSNGIMTEQCLLSPVNGTVSVTNTYSIDYTLFATQSAVLNAIFTLANLNYPLAMNTNAAQTEISQIP